MVRVSTQASVRPPPTEDEDWWKTLNNYDDMVDHVLPPEWFTARIDRGWWKTATLDS